MNHKSKLIVSLWLAVCSTFTLTCAGRNAPGGQTAAASHATPAATSPPAAAPPAPAPQDNTPRIEVAELKELIAKNAVVVLDVRSVESYNGAHAKGAISYPLDRIEKGDFKDLPKDKRIVAYCT